ncbi:MAG TPA: hypothetical protein EYQ86_02360 [Bacteroidetes bacterium]|nr:hypothetical protein [Bacteroidota bacterium]
MYAKTNMLNEVIVSNVRNKFIKRLGIQHFNQEDISTNPVVFGEADIIKLIQRQPGVKNISDGSSALYVNGGKADQNLLLLDGLNIDNPGHLMGMVSSFNSFAIKDIQFYPSYIPANFGGKLSSVLDLSLKEADFNKSKLAAQLSLLSANIKIETPLVKEKASILLSLRKSLWDFILNPDQNVSYIPSFYDLNINTVVKANTLNQLKLFFYGTKDQYIVKDEYSNQWGSYIGGLKWRHTFNPDFFMTSSIGINNYNQLFSVSHTKDTIEFSSKKSQFQLKTDFTYFINDLQKLKWGFINIFQNINSTFYNGPIYEGAAYVDFSAKLSLKHNLMFGLRQSQFKSSSTSIQYKLLPRICWLYSINDYHSFSIYVNKNAQNSHDLNNSSTSYSMYQYNLFTDSLINTQVSWQGGFTYVMDKAQWRLSFSSYYKLLTDQIDFVDHAQLFSSADIHDQIAQGIGKSHGMRLELSRSWKRTKTTISYEYSRSILFIESINSAMAYPSIQDMPHYFQCTNIFKFNNYFNLFVAWVWHSGKVVSLPVSMIHNYDYMVPVYAGRNNHRFPNYHRLDINLNWHIKKPKYFLYISAGVYNAYGQANGDMYLYDWADNNTLTIKQFSMFRFFPSLSIKIQQK